MLRLADTNLRLKPMAFPITSVTIFNVTLQVMSITMSSVRTIIDDLKRRKNAVACAGKGGLQLYLKGLGFDDTEGDTPGHRVFTHKKLSEEAGFISFSVDCGHRPRREMKLPYVVKVIRSLEKYEEFLKRFEEENYA